MGGVGTDREGINPQPRPDAELVLLDAVMLVEPIVLLTVIPASLALNLTPGADMMFALGQGLRGGPRAGLLAAAGISTGGLVDLDQADPIAEADFHMAYGLYDQAAELLAGMYKGLADLDRRFGQMDPAKAERVTTHRIQSAVELFLSGYGHHCDRAQGKR